jgi:cytochrome c-type biogenesis protein CcmF
MIAELGQLCLVLAFLASLLQAGAPLLQKLCNPHPVMHFTKPLAAAVFLLVASAFAALIACHVRDDFSVLTVVLNSHSSKPLLYKIVGSWGNHEGSMLLWMMVLAAGGFGVALLKAPDAALKMMTLSVLGMVASGFLAFILLTSNPFLRVYPPAANGEDLNPILQDIGLAFHPPTLYVGYVGFGIVFAYAMAGLLLKKIDADWARTVRPWILLPWSFLTLGIGAGSWWAYRELGWGGWWFWDPVENVSLLPWLTATALLHATMVLEKRGQLAGWVVLLAILTFTMSLIGTFIVRSGLITSVHAFAADPARGMFILAYIGVVSGAALLVYGFRQLPPSRPVALLSRSGFILVGNLLLLSAMGVVLIAILYPLMLELLHLPSISVGPQYFSATFLPITAGLPILAAIAPLVAWDLAPRDQLARVIKSLAPALAVALIIILALVNPPWALEGAGLLLGGWLLLGIYHYARRMTHTQRTLFTKAGMRQLAMITAHMGLALLVLGMTTTALFKRTYETPLTANAPMQLGDYTLRLTKAERIEKDNFITRRAELQLSRHGTIITTLSPELRYYPVRNMQTTEAALYSTPLHDIYVVIGESTYSGNGSKASTQNLGIRLYVSPGQQLVWAGFLLAGLGGFIALAAAFRRPEGDR